MRNIEKLAILAIGFITLMATAAMAPSLEAIQKDFITASPILIKLIITLPALICIPISLLNNLIIKKISKKTLIIIGLIFFTIGGLSSALAPNIYLLLITRAILGIGLGITAPLSLILIGDFFQGKERAKFMGFSTAVTNLGGIISTLLVGFLSSINWRYSFIIYAVAIAILLITIFFLPNDSNNVKSDIVEPTIHNLEAQIKLNKSVFKYAIIVLLGLIAFYGLPTNMAFLIKSKSFGGAKLAADLVSLSTLLSLVSAILFGKIIKKIGKNYSLIIFIIMFLGFLLLSLSENIYVVILGTILTGISFGSVIPYSMSFASNIVHKTHTALAIIIVTIGLYLGEFISPIVLQSIAELLKLNSITGSFFAASIISIIAFIFSIYTNVTDKEII